MRLDVEFFDSTSKEGEYKYRVVDVEGEYNEYDDEDLAKELVQIIAKETGILSENIKVLSYYEI